MQLKSFIILAILPALAWAAQVDGPGELPACGPTLAQMATENILEVVDRHPTLRRQALSKGIYRYFPSITTYSSEPPRPFRAKAKLVSDGHKGVLAKILLIRRAVYSIDLTTFILTPDEAGRLVLYDLKKAVERGVNVRMAIDSLGSLHPFHSDLKALLGAKPGRVLGMDGKRTNVPAIVEVRMINSVFDPQLAIHRNYLRLANLFVNSRERVAVGNRWHDHRSHDKSLIIDGDHPELAYFMAGGRNLTKHYHGIPYNTPETYHDMEVIARPDPSPEEFDRFRSAVLGQFERLFHHAPNKRLQPWRFFRGLLRRQDRLNAQMHERLLGPGTELGKELMELEQSHYLDEGFEESQALVLNEIHNLLPRKWLRRGTYRPNGSSVTTWMTNAIANAKTSIDIVSPYLYLYPHELSALRRWLTEDSSRRIRIFSTSLYSSDNTASQTLTDRDFGPRFLKAFEGLEDRAQLFTFGRLDGEGLDGNVFYGRLHGKYAKIDNQTVIASHNGDPRSRELNSELAFVFDGPETAAELGAILDQLAKDSVVFGSPEWLAIRNHPNLLNKRIKQRLTYPFVRWLLTGEI